MATGTGPANGGEESELPYEYLDLVKEAVAQLPAQQKKVWTLSRKEGLTYLQVAEQLQISRRNSKKLPESRQYRHPQIRHGPHRPLGPVLLLRK